MEKEILVPTEALFFAALKRDLLREISPWSYFHGNSARESRFTFLYADSSQTFRMEVRGWWMINCEGHLIVAITLDQNSPFIFIENYKIRISQC